MIIGIAAKAYSGKGEATRFLTNCRGFKEIEFARPIKDALEVMFDIDLTTLEQIHGKEPVLPAVGKSLRELYQTLGTDWGRDKIDTDIWVNQAARRYGRLAGYDVVFSDVRFENEAQFVRGQGGTIIHLRRSAAKGTRLHKSESGVKYQQGCDWILENNGTLPELYTQLSLLIEEIERGQCQEQKTS